VTPTKRRPESPTSEGKSTAANLSPEKPSRPASTATSGSPDAPWSTNEERFRLFEAVSEGSMAGIYVFRDGKFIYVNSALAEIFGYEREELIGKLGPADLAHPDDRDKVAEYARRRLAGEVNSIHYTVRGIRKDGSLVQCEALGQSVDLEGGKAIAGTLFDITEREQDRQHLLESEALFRGLAVKSPNGVFVNQSGRLVYANAAAEELTGYTIAELTGPDFDFLRLIAPDSLDLVQGNFRELMQGREQPPREVRLIRKDGHQLDAHVATRLISYQAEPAILGIITDVTYRKMAERELQRLLKEERRHRKLAEAVAKVGLSLTSDIQLPELLDMISRQSTEVFDVGSAFVWMVEGDELVGFAGYGTGIGRFVGRRLPLSDPESLATKVVREARPIYINRARASSLVNQRLLELFDAQAILGVPLIRGNKADGALVLLESSDPERFTDEDLEVAMVLGGQMAVAIENAQAVRLERRTLQQLTSLIQSSTLISSTLDLDAILARIAEEMCKAIDATSAYICTYDPESKLSTVVAEYYRAWATERESDLGQTYNLEDEFPGTVDDLEARRPAVSQVDDPQLSDSERQHMLLYGGKTTLTIPFGIAGRVSAYAEIWESRTRRVFTEEEIELCLTIGRQAAIAIENGRLYKRAQEDLAERRRAESTLAITVRQLEEAVVDAGRLAVTEAALRDSAAALSGTLDLDEVLDRILTNVGRVVPSDTVDIMLLQHEDGGDFLEGARGKGYDERGLSGWLERLRLPVDGVPSFRDILYGKRPYVIPDVRDSPVWVDFPETEWIRSYAAAPIRSKGEVIGLLNLCSETPGFYSQAHAEVLQSFADQAAVAIENARLFTQARQELADRQRAEQELMLLSEFNSSILEEMADGVAVQDSHGNFTFVNPAAAALVGYTTDEMIGQHWTVFIPPDQRSLVEQADERRRSGITDRYEIELLSKAGTRIPTLVSGRPRSTNGEFAGTIAVFTDISERKRAEQALRESNAQFRTLFEASPDAILLIDPRDQWLILDCNRTACTMNGYTRDELIGQSVDLINLTPGDPAERAEYLRRIRQSGALQLETFHRRKNGEVFPVEVVTSLITLGGREVVLGIDRDITERKRAEEAERAFLRTKEDFLVSASHSLRTPMHTLMGFLELLAEGQVDDPEVQKDFLGRALKDARHLADLVEKVVGTAKMEAGTVELDLVAVSVGDLITDTLQAYEGVAREKGIELSWESREPTGLIRVDRARMRHALSNLIENAIQYSEDGMTVRVEAEQNDLGVEIRVIDQGVGLSKGDQLVIFEKPYLRSAGPTGDHVGGLGLYLTRTIVEAHGGSIRVESEPGEGSVFTISIPRHR
jgi:PAS domain S-box-containing protein